MRKFTVLVVAAAAFFVARGASAATVDLTFTKQADGTTWQLTMDVASSNSVGLTDVTQVAFGFATSPLADFVIAAGAPVDPFSPTGTSKKNTVTIGGAATLHLLLAGPFSDPNTVIGTVGTTHLVLGNLLNAPFSGTVLEAGFRRGDATQDGGTILGQQPDFNGIAESEVAVHFVPEPGALLLLGIGIAGLSLVRRKA